MKQMTILLVEDDNDDADLFREAIVEFKDFPVKLLVAGDGREALNIIINSSEQLHHVFLDINMPIMDGIECLQHLREDLGNNIPVTVLSTGKPLKIDLALYSAVDFIEKPANYIRLLNLVSEKLRSIRLKHVRSV
jgi:CheY-like chemotaxis protein